MRVCGHLARPYRASGRQSAQWLTLPRRITKKLFENKVNSAMSSVKGELGMDGKDDGSKVSSPGGGGTLIPPHDSCGRAAAARTPARALALLI